MMFTVSSIAILVVIHFPFGHGQMPNWRPFELGTVSLRHCAFVEAYFNTNTSQAYEDRWTLYVSTFNPAQIGNTDEVYWKKGLGRYIDDVSNLTLDLMDKSALWPNNPDYMPSEIGGAEGVIWTSGFLVIGKQNGQLQMYDTTDEVNGPYNIASLDNENWSYHRVIWKDMDADGDLDALSARFRVQTIGPTLYDLVWFENQGLGFIEGWPEHIITSNGPDVHFTTLSMTSQGRNYEVILVGEFWNEQLTVYWTEDVNDNWTIAQDVRSRVIDDTTGRVFDVLAHDLNGDGAFNLLCTGYDRDAVNGSVYVYDIPEDFKVDAFPRRIIATSFVPNEIGGGEVMSPGTSKTFYPSDEYANEVLPDQGLHKPWLLLSGDDDGRMYILQPVNDDRLDWNYTKNVLTDQNKNIMGKAASGDFNNDGYSDIVVAYYSDGNLYFYTFNPNM